MKCLSPWLMNFSIALVPAVCAAADRGLPGPAVPEGLGVNIHFTDPGPGEMARFAEAGYAMVRMDFAWEAVERQPGRYDFSAYDRLMGHLRKAEARPILILDYGNRLYDHGQSPQTELARAAFARFAAAAARHFRGQGVIWEIWNEPNIRQFWKPVPDASAYARLATETARAIRSADRDAVIVAPGSSTFPWPFLETIFAAGLLEHLDAVSVHPYRESSPETAASDYGRLRALIARFVPPSRRTLPIISSEWGYSTAKGAVSELRQGQFLARQWLVNFAAGVNLSIFYDWRDDGDDPMDREARFGTVRRSLEPKPSFLAAQELIHTLRGYTFRHRLQGSSPLDWKLLFEQAGERRGLMLVEWSADPREADLVQTPRYRSVDPGGPEFYPLRRLANIKIAPGPLAEQRGDPALLGIRLFNTESQPATVRLVATADNQAASATLELTVQPGESAIRVMELPVTRLRVEHRQVQLKWTWNDEPLPAIAPLEVWRADPLVIKEAPTTKGLDITIENPSRSELLGSVLLEAEGQRIAGTPVNMRKGQPFARLVLPQSTMAHHVLVVDQTGKPVTQTTSTRFEAMPDFPDGPDLGTEIDSILFVDNRPQSPHPLKVVAADAEAPGPYALEIPYHFDPGWRYLGVSFRKAQTIPAAALGAMMWVRGNHSGDALRCRFRDATGQTFQVDLARLDWSDWRPLRIDFSAGSGAGHWGGADDGVPHRPLAWEALLLIDSSRRNHPQPQSILVASPYYVMNR